MLKFKIELLYSPKTFSLQCPGRSPSRRTTSAPSETRNVQLPHDRTEEPSLVQVPTHGTQLHVYHSIVPLAIPVHILATVITHGPDNRPLLLGPSRRNKERMSQPAKFKVVASYKSSLY
jgi:hypothetical protein